MREIKFRAWDKENKEMVYDDGDLAIFRAIKRMAYKSNHKTHDFMQFTGLKDKNGVDIYEGDVVKLEAWKSSVTVVFDKGAFKYQIDKATAKSFLDITIWGGAEVIGNIAAEALQKPTGAIRGRLEEIVLVRR